MGRFVFLGDNLAVDLLNTVVVQHGRVVDVLADWKDVMAWGAAAGVVHRSGVKPVPRGEPAAVRRFRETLRRGLLTWAERGRVTPAVLGAINRVLAADPLRAIARRGKGGRVELGWDSSSSPRVRLYGAIARSAAELLAQGDPQRLRRCANPDCVLLFYDVSKAGRRRWCSMQTCGGRAKVQAYYARQSSSR
jgi:predicted RNA-binding Zn ribbon-like protein